MSVCTSCRAVSHKGLEREPASWLPRDDIVMTRYHGYHGYHVMTLRHSVVAKKLNHKSMVARLLGIGIGWAVCLSVLFSCCKFTFKSNQIYFRNGKLVTL